VTSSQPDPPIMALFRANNLIAVSDKLRGIGCIGLLLLIACTFCLDVIHGSRLGEDQVAFFPIYRLRQSLAVAISRLHDPSPGRYLAYKSVVNVLDENGFAFFDGEPGPRLDIPGREALLADGPRLDRIIQQAIDVPIDASLSPEIIQANELGYADYIYFGFRLFGEKISSLYYFFYLIVAATCLLYSLQFRKSPFLLFLLVIFLGELFFLENYANSYGMHLKTVTNSRLFSGLSLVPALHVLFVLWRRQPPRAFTVTAVIVQSVIFAFLLSCRTELAWQVAMIAVVACGIGLSVLLSRRDPRHRHLIDRLVLLWPAAIFLAVVFAYSAVVSMSADQRYAVEPKAHIVWHEVMIGLLRSNKELHRQYFGDAPHGNSDGGVYTAVIRDLNARNDSSSPIARRLDDGQLTIEPMRGWAEYDRLVRSLVLRIVRDHPLAVLETVPHKIREQLTWYDNPVSHSMSWENLQVPIILIAAGALICMAAGGFTIGTASLGSTVGIIAIVLLFAAATPMVQPSAFSIGTLFCCLGVVAILVPYAAMLLIGKIITVKSKAEGVSPNGEFVR
jgi:hypothetical protein